MADVTVPRMELRFLIALEELIRYNKEIWWPVAWANVWSLQGTGHMSRVPNFDLLTDEQLVKGTTAVVSPRAMSYPPYGYAQDFIEEDVGGKIPKVDYQGYAGHADLSPGGPASLIGKICLELARRLKAEISGDRRARAYGGWEAADDPPAQD